LSEERFVPNDARLDHAGQQLMLITGPNMAGKSTYIRQVALLTLLAHTGSFVPAAAARIDLVDRIFTRIGASDDLARGQSTFMVEMSETANILNNATARSLIILDEIGRGTSTFDGLSLAWSIVEHLHNVVGAKTLFATHYHELTELAARLPRLKNFNVAVREWNEQIVFLRKIVEGATDKSYGIQVARLAGVPKEVLERAKEILSNLEESELTPEGKVRQHAAPARSWRNSKSSARRRRWICSRCPRPRRCASLLEASRANVCILCSSPGRCSRPGAGLCWTRARKLSIIFLSTPTSSMAMRPRWPASNRLRRRRGRAMGRPLFGQIQDPSCRARGLRRIFSPCNLWPMRRSTPKPSRCLRRWSGRAASCSSSMLSRVWGRRIWTGRRAARRGFHSAVPSGAKAG
jgi:hypothetical protein